MTCVASVMPAAVLHDSAWSFRRRYQCGDRGREATLDAVHSSPSSVDIHVEANRCMLNARNDKPATKVMNGRFAAAERDAPMLELRELLRPIHQRGSPAMDDKSSRVGTLVSEIGASRN
ncbi:hypothetical protein [Bradyrhizobium sp. B120]|uniref:hypothetical protein n=1 Tax=Bradyrhizobium sp. B120 TaxID=3410088 RepID=UPI003B981A2C